MIHIVFNEADVNTLQQAIAEDESLAGDIFQVKDDYAVGPVHNLYTEHGRENRRAWWEQVLQGTALAESTQTVDDDAMLKELQVLMQQNPDQEIWIWVAQNKHDVSGYYFILPYFKEYAGRVNILFLNNLPFINEKGAIFYPQWLHEILPSEFRKAKKLARSITTSEWELEPDEWDKIAAENRDVRLLEGGKKLLLQDADFYDSNLLKHIPAEFQKLSKTFQQYYAKEKETTGDAFLLWRLKTLAALQQIEMQGDTTNLKTVEVKRVQ